ncbi:MAG: hypothetical protein BJ554DRAFT_6716 [Olpidium bornovanus]|uniref:Uncharacterized protein n=1 Tax=Olpidium bornovanus TaxID=278681 RepID=A0A8H8DJY3_9FUNG|nr:MAG: hypothetical protein BJ554DRAFT_6716 [Olpidium bornovanus]
MTTKQQQALLPTPGDAGAAPASPAAGATSGVGPNAGAGQGANDQGAAAGGGSGGSEGQPPPLPQQAQAQAAENVADVGTIGPDVITGLSSTAHKHFGFTKAIEDVLNAERAELREKLKTSCPQGLPARSYLEHTVVPVLLEGLKALVKERWVRPHTHPPFRRVFPPGTSRPDEIFPASHRPTLTLFFPSPPPPPVLPGKSLFVSLGSGPQAAQPDGVPRRVPPQEREKGMRVVNPVFPDTNPAPRARRRR